MDLRAELLAVLDNPSSVWSAVLNNLVSEPRIALMTLATFNTPIRIIDWQAAVARVSLESAVQFDVSMRVLDDQFVTLHRRLFDYMYGGHSVNFRNPSMDDFCATHLNSNVGFAIKVASQDPSLDQIERLIQLGSASTLQYGQIHSRTYGNIHSSLIANPFFLYSALITHLPQPVVNNADFRRVATLMTSLIVANGSGSSFDLKEIRSVLVPGLLQLDPERRSLRLFNLVDDLKSTEVLVWILGDQLDEFYHQLVESTSSLYEFDILVDFESYLGRSGSNAAWREKFLYRTEEWLSGEDDDIDFYDPVENRDCYVRIAKHLELEDESREEEWDDLVALAEEESMNEEDDDSWQESPNGEDDESANYLEVLAEEDRIKQAINSMFFGLVQAGPK